MLPLILLSLSLMLGRFPAPQVSAPQASAETWQAAGTLLECCTCNVPCTCNFGQGPTPYNYCYSLYAYRLKTARYEGVTLDGLVFGGCDGPKSLVEFLDSRATPAQRSALMRLAQAVVRKGGPREGKRQVIWTQITAEDDAHHFSLRFEGNGSFTASILMGGDDKNPIIVENNTTWPVARCIKGKTTVFDYTDTLGNRLQYTGRNANLGEFHLSGTGTAAANAVQHVAAKSCCTGASPHK
jgi:hypothetical protein